MLLFSGVLTPRRNAGFIPRTGGGEGGSGAGAAAAGSNPRVPLVFHVTEPPASAERAGASCPTTFRTFTTSCRLQVCGEGAGVAGAALCAASHKVLLDSPVQPFAYWTRGVLTCCPVFALECTVRPFLSWAWEAAVAQPAASLMLGPGRGSR